MRELSRFDFGSIILCLIQPTKIPMNSKDPFVSDSKVSPAKGSNKGYGDKNSFREV